MTPPTQAAHTAPVTTSEHLEHRELASGHAAIVGLQWGDEGKGQIVDLLTERFDVVVRYNGGNNAGHSVHIGDQKFALHLLPSGILHPDKLNVIGNGVVVDPSRETGILKEIEALRERGVSVGDNLRISDRAHVVLPYHKLEDALLDQAGAGAGDSTAAIGTTGRGIGPCYADKALRSTAIRMGDLLHPDRLRAKIERITALKNALLGALAAQSGQPFEPFDPEALIAQALVEAEALKPFICDTTRLLHEAVSGDRHLLFEGANATLLDIDHGTYPYVTSSSCSSLGIGPGTGLPARYVSDVIGVAKCYTSRVGGGPHPTELDDATGERIREQGQEFGTTTGRPRRCGWMDLCAVRYSAQINGCTALVCTGLSVLADIESLKLCVGYRYRGRKLDAFPADADILAEAEPIYETLPGFAGPIDEVGRFDALPAGAQAYIRRIEQFVGVPVRLVCVGRRRDQILFKGA